VSDISYGLVNWDTGLFSKKISSLGTLVQGPTTTKTDVSIRPLTGELVSVKKYASAYLQINIDTDLRSYGVDNH